MKKTVSLALCAILIFALFTACGAPKSAEKKEITVMVPEWAVPSDEMLSAFEADTGISVTMNTVGWDDIRSKIAIASTGSAAAADVVEVDWSWLGEFDSADWLEPLDISAEDIADMPTLSSFTTADGRILAMPYANDFRIAYCNTEDFTAAGIEKLPETWDEVYDAMLKIRDGGHKKYPFAMPMNSDESATTSLIWLAFSNDGIVFNDDGTLHRESVLPALEFLNRAVNEDMLTDPAIKTASGMETYRKLTADEASFIVGPTSFVSRVNDENESKVVGKISPTLLPGKTATAEQTFALPEGIGVTKFSKNKEAAKEFVLWFTSPETQVQLNAVQNTIPTRTSVLEKLINDEVLKNTGALLEQSKRIASPFPGGVPDYYSEMSNAIYNAINSMVLGSKTPQQAFDEMDAAVSALALK